MKVKLMRTFPDAVGTWYTCCVCDRREQVGWTQCILASEEEIQLGAINKHLQTALGLPLNHDERVAVAEEIEEVCEEDQRRNEYWSGRAMEGEPMYQEYGHVCPRCVDRGPEYIRRRLMLAAQCLRERLDAVQQGLAEGISDVPSAEDIELASRYYRGTV